MVLFLIGIWRLTEEEAEWCWTWLRNKTRLQKQAEDQMGSLIPLCKGLCATTSYGEVERRSVVERDHRGRRMRCVSGDGEEERWCGENHFSFYFVKQLAYDGLEIKAKIDGARDEIYNGNSEKNHIANRKLKG
ncbi:hypothetical protein HA466_0269810 [Hirschfeldia incana]|nr:hypothetical protein HA466_0269810 [Hirschfeldia incana]KAJ0234853.1 hypothetical protein HA466_0269810 [Hirschfeldia incana]